MNNDTYQALLVYKVATSAIQKLQNEADDERALLYDKWSAVVRGCSGDGQKALEALREFENGLKG
jgi:hypothetical protein